MQTNYEFTKSRSSYHYDTSRMDPRWDCVRGLGQFSGDWQDYVPRAIEMSKIVNWANKTYTPDSGESTRKDLEVNDLLAQGLDPDRQIMYRVVHDLSTFPMWQQMEHMIGFDQSVAKVQIQLTGDCMNVHVDKMDGHYRDVPEAEWHTIGRVSIMLTDWEPGQFWNFGNFNYSHWKAGDFFDFDWRHVPHGTANSSLKPRVIMTVSGIKTAKSKAFFQQSRNAKTIQLK
jgi:hypothetical protein